MGYGKEYDSEPNPCGCGEDDCPDCAPRRIAALEAELKERGEEASRLRFTLGALVLSGKLDDVTAREVREPGEKLKAQMDALEAENERLRAQSVAHEIVRNGAADAMMVQQRDITKLRSRAESAESALAAAREENERLKRSMDNRREMRWVDMTPDAGLVARILSAYIDNTSCTDNLAGLDPESFVCKMMNEHTAQRNVLLNSALAALRARADDAGRVERAARMIIELELGHDGAEFSAADMTNAPGLARRILAAADGREP